MSRMCAYCGVGEASTMALPCVSTAGHWFINTPSVSVVTQYQLCQRGEPCAENLKLTLEAENALLKKKLAIALRGLDEYASQSNWAAPDPNAEEPYDQMWTGDKGEHSFNGYELARRVKAEIEEVK